MYLSSLRSVPGCESILDVSAKCAALFERNTDKVPFVHALDMGLGCAEGRWMTAV